MRTRRPPPAPLLRSAFAGFRFPPEVIAIAVRWYLRYGLSYRDVEELLIERGIEVDHVTVYRWVQRFTPLLADATRPCRHAVGDRWQVDETYVKVAGQWRYVYRAIDQFGQVIDVFVSPRRDVRAARRFLQQAVGATKVTPSEVTTDDPVHGVVIHSANVRRGFPFSTTYVAQQPRHHQHRPRWPTLAVHGRAGWIVGSLPVPQQLREERRGQLAQEAARHGVRDVWVCHRPELLKRGMAPAVRQVYEALRFTGSQLWRQAPCP